MTAPTTNQIKVLVNGTKLPTISASEAVSIDPTFETEETVSDTGQLARGIKRMVQIVKVKVLMGSDTQYGIMSNAFKSIRGVILSPTTQFNLTLKQGSNSVSGYASIKTYGTITALPSDTLELTFISMGQDFTSIYPS